MQRLSIITRRQHNVAQSLLGGDKGMAIRADDTSMLESGAVEVDVEAPLSGVWDIVKDY